MFEKDFGWSLAMKGTHPPTSIELVFPVQSLWRKAFFEQLILFTVMYRIQGDPM